jgi:serine/threonine protein kinase
MATTPKSPHLLQSDDALPSTLGRYVGRTLDSRYQLLSTLGRGGMGSVFFAKHVVLGKTLAVKVLHVAPKDHDREYTRLFREAQTAAQIGHPNIIDVLDVGVASEGHPYLVMEYLDGEDVASILRRKTALPLATACAIVEPVLLALSAAHGRSIVHRDIKPANIFVVRRRDSLPTVKLIDFGIAKELGPTQQAGLTLPGSLLGTPSYMPPEQATGVEDVDIRADIYGVGISLYEMLTGRLPFEGANYNETLYRIVTDDAPSPESPLETLPADAISIVERAMHKDPVKRFQSATEFLDAVKQLDAWNSRSSAFLKLVADLKHAAVEQVDIEATQLSPESPVARGAAKATPTRSPSDVVETMADGTSLQPRQTVAKGTLRWLLPVSIIVSLGAMLLLFSEQRQEPVAETPLSQTAASSQAPKPKRVSITVNGAPEGATVLYDGKRVPKNPFQVEGTNTVMPIRVEVPGYQPFVATLIPTRDTTIRVELLPGKSAPKSSAMESGAQHTKAAARPAPKQQQPGPKVRESGRGTFYTEKFE